MAAGGQNPIARSPRVLRLPRLEIASGVASLASAQKFPLFVSVVDPEATTSSSPARRFCNGQVFATKKLSLFDNRGDLIGNHLLPAGFSALDLTQDISGENVHNRRIGSNHRCDKMVFEKMSVKIAEVELNL
jgi:hypothetical protein